MAPLDSPGNETLISSPGPLGNDVVDIAHPKCRGRDRDERLLARILHPLEREWLEAAAGSDRRVRRLWSLWAGKETGFKVACKSLSPERAPVFRHREFLCRLGEEESGGITRLRGGVETPVGIVRVEGTANDAFVHLTGWLGEAPARFESGMERWTPDEVSLEEFREHFSAEEWGGVHSPEAARARLLVRERLASHLHLPTPAGGARRHPIEILTSHRRPGRTPPRLRVRGELRPDLDVSISHHGRYIAWAFFVPDDAGWLDQNLGR